MAKDRQFKIEFVGSPNHYNGRRGRMPLAIVDHITDGSMPGCLSWMQNPKAEASANYLVTRDGRILQLVKDEDAAWANGAVNNPDWPLYDGANPNLYTLSVEHEGFDGSLTEDQYQATLWLHRRLVEKWGIPVDDDHIIGHNRIDSVNRPYCPGPEFPWERLFADLGAVKDSGVSLVVNGKQAEVPLRIVNGRTEALLSGHWVQLRALANMLHADIGWNPETRTVYFDI